MMQSFVSSGARRLSHRGSSRVARLLGTGLLVAACSSSRSSDESESASLLGADGPIFEDGAGTSSGEDDPNQSVRGYFEGQACAGQVAGAEAAPSVLQLLVDTSGSMNESAPGARQSKWNVTREAVLSAIASMPEDTSVGVVFYPNVPGALVQPCIERETAVSIAELGRNGSQQRQRIQRAFQRQRPAGGTPTHDAYEYAVADMTESSATGSRYMVVITDGIPTYSLGCEGTGNANDPVDSSPLIEAARLATANGVRTFVIGSPGSEDARDSLSRWAQAGGTAPAGCSHGGPDYCHFDMTEERDLGAGLTNALGIISGVALGCRYAVPPAPDGATLDPSRVNVLFAEPGSSEELIGQSLEDDCEEGWRYADGQATIRLCSNTCERVQASETGSLTLQFGCATELR